jgi:hypothetical protein
LQNELQVERFERISRRQIAGGSILLAVFEQFWRDRCVFASSFVKPSEQD